MVNRLSVFAAACLLALLASGCSTANKSTADVDKVPAASQKNDRIPAFSAAQPSGALPKGWQPWVLHPSKRKTLYSLVSDGGTTVVRADAASSASGLIAPLDIDLSVTPEIEWRWRTDSHIAEADNSAAATEDAPVRLVLAFDGDKSALPIRERMFAERVRLISGRELPYASLMYIWGNRAPKETLIDNPHSMRIKKLVVDTGPTRLGEWRLHRRNVVADYTRAFGKPPGRLIGIGVMTDTDNTGTRVAAYYGDIRLLEAGADQGPGANQTSP